MLTTAVAFLIVHPGLYPTAEAHKQNSRVYGAKTLVSDIGLYYTSTDCTGRHWHVGPQRSTKELPPRIAHIYSYQEISIDQDYVKSWYSESVEVSDDAVIESGMCQDNCKTLEDLYDDCKDGVEIVSWIGGGIGIFGIVFPLAGAIGILGFAIAGGIRAGCESAKWDEELCPDN